MARLPAGVGPLCSGKRTPGWLRAFSRWAAGDAAHVHLSTGGWAAGRLRRGADRSLSQSIAEPHDREAARPQSHLIAEPHGREAPLPQSAQSRNRSIAEPQSRTTRSGTVAEPPARGGASRNSHAPAGRRRRHVVARRDHRPPLPPETGRGRPIGWRLMTPTPPAACMANPNRTRRSCEATAPPAAAPPHHKTDPRHRPPPPATARHRPPRPRPRPDLVARKRPPHSNVTRSAGIAPGITRHAPIL